MSGVQCLKRLYWQVHEPELGGVPDAAAVAIMEQGREVGRLARQLFAGGVEVSSRDPEQAIRTTRELIANPEVPAIFEAAFERRWCICTGGHPAPPSRRQMASDRSEVHRRPQRAHLDDVAIQHRVVSRSGLDLASSCLAHVNRNYV